MAHSQDLHRRISQAIVARVGGDIKDLGDRATALAGRAGLLEGRADQLESRSDGLDGRLGTLELRTFRSVTVELPQLISGNTEVNVTWAVPFIGSDYGVTFTLEAGPLVLPKLTAGIKAGTRIGAGCVAVVVNASQLTIPAGALLHALAWRVVGQG